MNARVVLPNDQNLRDLADRLSRGEIVGIPTETVYGLAAHAFRPDALVRVFEAKERPHFDPLILHVGPQAGSVEALEELRILDSGSLSPAARRVFEDLISAFWPGPLTLVVPKNSAVPDLATSGLPTVAVRMPRHPVTQRLLSLTGFPLAAPSANRFGKISPTRAEHVVQELGGRIGWVLDGGPCEIGVESSVVSIESDGSLFLLRPGGVTREDLERVSGKLPSDPVATSTPAAPGMLASHYAPRKPLRLLPRRFSEISDGELKTLFGSVSGAVHGHGLLLISGDLAETGARMRKLVGPSNNIRILSPLGNLHEAAQGLFQALRELDGSSATHLFAEPCTETKSLGHAISDRLVRASRRP